MKFLKLGLIKILLFFIPARLKFKITKLLYNYESYTRDGIEVVVSYLREYNLKFLLNTKEIIGWKIFFFGEYEKDTNDILRKYIQSGDIVVEAGANNGSETLLLDKLTAEQGKVYAFEPVPHVFRHLKINLLLNSMDQAVYTYQQALGEADTTVQIHVLPEDFGNQGMSSKRGHSAATKQIDVEQVTLDTWVQQENIQRLDFIKMDVQGGEIDILKGGQESIRRFQPVIYTEASNAWLDIVSLYNILSSMGYKVFLVKDNLQNTPLELANLISGDWLAYPKFSNNS